LLFLGENFHYPVPMPLDSGILGVMLSSYLHISYPEKMQIVKIEK